MKLSSISAVATAIIVMMMVTPTIAADGATTVDLSPLYSTGVEFVAALVSGVLIALSAGTVRLLPLVRRRPNRPRACSAWLPVSGPPVVRQGWRSHLRSP